MSTATVELAMLSAPPAWLEAIADGSAVAASLRRRVPAVRGCEVEQIRLEQDGAHALYRATLADAGNGPGPVVDLLAEIEPPGGTPLEPVLEGDIGDRAWRCTLPDLSLRLAWAPRDGGLVSLPELLDAGRAGRLIEAALARSDRFAGFRALTCEPRVTRYNPGSRCTVVYELGLPSDAAAHWPKAVVGKTYLGEKGRVAWDAMLALWESPMRSSPWAAIAEPLALVGDGRVLLQRALPHRQTLKAAVQAYAAEGSRAESDRLHDLLGRSGSGLADLHRSSVEAASATTWLHKLDDVRRVIGHLVALVPTLQGAAESLISGLSREPEGDSAPAPVPSHGSFRPAQVVVADGDEIGFIDFDNFCRAEPAHDVALFCSALRDAGLRAALNSGNGSASALEMLDGLCQSFVAGYERSADLDRARVSLWETLNAVTGVLNCWTRAKFNRLDYRMALLHHQFGKAPG
jgi:Ser/Thr protein kinase RdoA (MazF antagonist)